MKVFLTGATGFVGQELAKKVIAAGHVLFAAIRQANVSLHEDIKTFVVDDIVSQCWGEALAGKEVVIHCAARAHVMNDESTDPLAVFRKVNVDGTLNLARQAAEAGVKRFIFISSIKVNGEETECGKPYAADDTPAPIDPYGISKLEAEQGLLALAAETGMEVTIIRPVLVYGPGVKGNFASMINLVEKGIPLPLGSIHNKRSLVGIDNLVDLIIRCIDHPAAANQVFLAGDGEDLSTTQLLRSVAKAMGRPARLIPVSTGLLQFGATLLGKKAMAQRLLGSLQVDISKTRELLGWTPPVSVEEGLKRCFFAGKD
ncbi:UDP-glucose 4-epimerase family protein [Serpens gallinarum]|uniref:SDR family oxidoreductase n=1 Tax=Serpens gallinarum TaxID=2763075 RepID=A0ABR8TSV3_9PSED|nr:SDR family oxidoreductase [Serpens gallinarum]MBD7978568.1 SDR family oxidoreductase [Serpens gallinarum]